MTEDERAALGIPIRPTAAARGARHDPSLAGRDERLTAALEAFQRVSEAGGFNERLHPRDEEGKFTIGPQSFGQRGGRLHIGLGTIAGAGLGVLGAGVGVVPGALIGNVVDRYMDGRAQRRLKRDRTTFPRPMRSENVLRVHDIEYDAANSISQWGGKYTAFTAYAKARKKKVRESWSDHLHPRDELGRFARKAGGGLRRAGRGAQRRAGPFTKGFAVGGTLGLGLAAAGHVGGGPMAASALSGLGIMAHRQGVRRDMNSFRQAEARAAKTGRKLSKQYSGLAFQSGAYRAGRGLGVVAGGVVGSAASWASLRRGPSGPRGAGGFGKSVSPEGIQYRGGRGPRGGWTTADGFPDHPPAAPRPTNFKNGSHRIRPRRKVALTRAFRAQNKRTNATIPLWNDAIKGMRAQEGARGDLARAMDNFNRITESAAW